MQTLAFNAGMDLVTKLPTEFADFQWLLVTDAYTGNRDEDDVTNISFFELTAVGYARATFATVTRTVDNDLDLVVFTHEAITFGTMAPTPSPAAGWAVLIYNPGADDTTAVPVLAVEIADPANDALPTLSCSVRGLVRISQAA